MNKKESKKEDRCWICGRTANEVWDSITYNWAGFPGPGSMLSEIDKGYSHGKKKICQVCSGFMWYTVKEYVDELPGQLDEDFEDYIVRIIEKRLSKKREGVK